MTAFTREDFEHAARAAGKHSQAWADPGQINDKGGLVQFIGLGRVETWNPRDDDGDALRLAVDCGMDLSINDEFVMVMTVDGAFRVSGDSEEFKDHFGDKSKAVRYAVFKRAIAIGKAMP